MFTRDGKFLAFLSNRVHDPIYDAHMFDLGFLPGIRPYLVGLAADTPSPFGPQLNGRPATQADKPDSKKGSEAKDEPDAVEPVLVEFAGIQERIEPVPVSAGAYRGLRAAERFAAVAERAAAGRTPRTAGRWRRGPEAAIAELRPAQAQALHAR